MSGALLFGEGLHSGTAAGELVISVAEFEPQPPIKTKREGLGLGLFTVPSWDRTGAKKILHALVREFWNHDPEQRSAGHTTIPLVT
jgi:hypothetical protein